MVRLIWLEALAICAGGAAALGLALALLGGGWIEAWLRARLPFAPSDRLMRGDAAAAAGARWWPFCSARRRRCRPPGEQDGCRRLPRCARGRRDEALGVRC